MPEVMMGSGQLNEGIALVQQSTHKQKRQGYRILIASIIEEKIIRPLLRANSPELDEQPEFIWELPTEEDIKWLKWEGKDVAFWGSDSPLKMEGELTPLRQTIVLFMAAEKKEL